jgi:hypothetical protein
VPYLVYSPRFEDWEILRFLLPALPFILIVCAGGVALVVRERSHPVRMQLAAIIVAVIAAVGSYMFVSSRHLIDLWQQELRYRLVGDWFAKNTPANSVAIAALHGGSLRYYSGRPTIRPEKLPEGSLPQTIESLDRAGYETYIVLEQGDELEEYQRRFHPDAIDSLESTPQARIRGVYIIRLTNKHR